MKKLLCMLLTVLMMLSAVACGNKGDGETETTPSTEPTETQKLASIDTIPKKDFANNDYTVLVRTEFEYEFAQTETSGDRLNTAIIRRNSQVQERFNLNLQIVKEPGNWQNRDNFKTRLSNAVKLSPCPYDLVVGAQNQMCAYITEGMFVDLMPVQSLNGFENPWWFDGFVENVSLKDRLYFVVGDAGVTLLENCNVVAFNKGICDANSIEYPYDLVKEKEWTLEALIEITNKIGYDNTNQTTPGPDAGDRFSIIAGDSMLRGFTTSFNIPTTAMDENGIPYMSMDDPKFRAVDVIDAFRAGLVEPDDRFYVSKTEGEILQMFNSGRSLFMLQNLSGITTVRQTAEIDFGILPYPMYDKAQGEYYTHVYETLSVFAIPVTARSVEDSGLILEALGAASYDLVTPEYFELVLKGQNARDIESYEMVEMIRENITFNFGFVHATALATNPEGTNGPNGLFNNLVKKNDTMGGVMNRYNSGKSGWSLKLGELYEKYASMQ